MIDDLFKAETSGYRFDVKCIKTETAVSNGVTDNYLSICMCFILVLRMTS